MCSSDLRLPEGRLGEGRGEFRRQGFEPAGQNPNTGPQLALLDAPPPAAPAPAAIQVAADTPAYKDGTYKGTLADAYFGDLQVAAVIANGRLADVQVLTYPANRSRSARINQSALPRLKQEAITLQNANVHIVSGATPTSRAFAESLSAALRSAR